MGVPGLGERSHILRNPPITKLFLAHENLIEEQTNHKKKKKMTVQIKTTALINNTHHYDALYPLSLWLTRLQQLKFCLLFTVRLLSIYVFSLFSLIHFEVISASVSSHI